MLFMHPFGTDKLSTCSCDRVVKLQKIKKKLTEIQQIEEKNKLALARCVGRWIQAILMSFSNIFETSPKGGLERWVGMGGWGREAGQGGWGRVGEWLKKGWGMVGEGPRKGRGMVGEWLGKR